MFHAVKDTIPGENLKDITARMRAALRRAAAGPARCAGGAATSQALGTLARLQGGARGRSC